MPDGNRAGAPVERQALLPVVPDATLNRHTSRFCTGESLPENSTASFPIIAAGPRGEREALDGLRWSLKKIEAQLPVVPLHQHRLELTSR